MRSIVIIATLLAGADALAADIHWGSAQSGSFDVAGNWAEGVVPGAGDNAVIDATGAAYTVDLGPSKTVGGLVVQSADALVELTGSNANGSVVITAAGGVDVEAGTLLLQSQNTTFASNLTAGGAGITVGVDGTLRVGRGSGGTRVISGDLHSTGTVQIAVNTTLSKPDGVYINEGTFLVQDAAAGGTAVLNVGGGQTFVQQAGTLTTPQGAPSASFGIVDAVGGTFDFEGGDVIGQQRIRTTGALVVGAASEGQGSFLLGGSATLTGDVHAAQSVLIQGNNTTGGTTVLATGDVRVDGTVRIVSANTSFNSDLDMGGHVLTVGAGGTLSLENGSGGARSVIGSITNEGTVAVSVTSTLPAGSAVYTNRGQWNVTAGTLTLQNGGAFRLEDGELAVAGGAVNVDTGSFTMTGGQVTGQPRIRGATLTIDGADGAGGAASFLVGALGNTQPHLGGTVHAGQQVLVSGQNLTASTTAVATGDLVVDGLLTLRSADTNFTSSLDLAGHTLRVRSGGTLSIEAGSGGVRTILGDIQNDGTVTTSFSASLSKPGATYENRGTWDVNGGTLTVSGGTFELAGGDVTAPAAFNVDGGTFHMSGGTVSAGRPRVRGSTLSIDAAADGSARFLIGALGNTQPHIAGTIHAEQDVKLSGQNITANTVAVADSDVIVDGLLTLRSENTNFTSSLDMGGNTLFVGAGGTVSLENGSGGARSIFGNIENDGTVDVSFTSTMPTGGATYANRGVWNVSGVLTVTGGDFLQEDGDVTVSGVMNVDTSSFLMTGGTVSAGRPIIRGSTLDIDPGAGGAARFLLGALGGTQPTLSGEIHASQDVKLSGQNVTASTVAVAGSDVVVGGLLTLRSENSNFTSSLDLKDHTLLVESTGRVSIENGSGGARSIFGNIENDGVVDVSFSSSMPTVDAVYTNRGTWNVSGNALTITSGRFELEAGRLSVAGAGALNFDAGTFHMSGGTVTGQPRIRGSTLDIGPNARAAASFLVGALGARQPHLAGTVHAAQSVKISGQNITANTVAVADGDLHVNGSLVIRSENTNFTSSLDLAGHTLFVDEFGTVSLENGSGGARSILGSIVNDGVVSVSFTSAMPKAGAVYTNRGTWDVSGTLTLSNGAFQHDGGTVSVTGAFNVDASTFTMTGGTVTGRPRIRGSTLTIDAAATGAAPFLVGALGQTQPHVAGEIHEGQDVLITGQNITNNTVALADSDLVVDGLLSLRSENTNLTSSLDMNGHVLDVTETGRVSLENGSGGARSIFGDVTNAGTFDVSFTSSLPRAGGTIINRGTWNVAAPFTITGSGTTVRLEGGAFNVQNGGAANVDGCTTLVLGGTVTGVPRIRAGSLQIDAGAVEPVAFLVGALGGAQPHLQGVIHAGQTVEISGQNITANTVAAADDDVVVQGLLFIRSENTNFTSQLDMGAHTLLIDGGTVRTENGSGGARGILGDIENHGRLETDFTSAYQGGTLLNDVDGVIAGNARMNLADAFSNAGTFAPGTAGAHGTLTVSKGVDVTGLATRIGGSGAGQLDVLNVLGAVTLSGKISVALDPGFVPVEGNVFTVLTASSVAGAFADFAGTDIARGLSFAVKVNATNVQLVATRVSSFLVEALSSPVSGEPFDIRVTALDTNDAVDTGYTGDIFVTADNPFSTLAPPGQGPISIIAADQGVHTVTGLVLKRAGQTTLLVTDPSVPPPGLDGPLVVDVAPAVQGNAPRLVVTGVTDAQFLSAPVTFTATIASDDPLASSSLALDIDTPLDAGTPVTVSAEGPHAVTMSATDIAGRNGSDALSFVIDLTPPLVTVNGVTPGLVSQVPVTVSVAVDDDNPDPASLVVTVDGAPLPAGGVVSADGAHVVVATATDLAGNTTTETVPFIIDTSAPVITFSGFTQGAAINPTVVRPVITITDDTPVTSTATLDDKPFIPGELVGDGGHVLAVHAEDALGHPADASAVFTVDSIAPQVTITGVSDGGRFASGVAAFVDVQDAHLSSAAVTLDGATYVDGTPIDEPGDHVLAVHAVDGAGHVTDVTVRFNVAANVPNIFITGVDEGVTYSQPVLPVITTDDPTALVVVTLDDLPYDGGEIGADGKHTLHVEAENAAGTASRDVRFTIDGTPPDLVITGVVDGGVYRDPVTPDVQLSTGDTRAITATLDDGDFLLGTEVSAAGTHVLVVVVTDAAGNEARAQVTFTIDPSAPSLAILGVSDGEVVNHDVTLDVAAALDPGIHAELVTTMTLDGEDFVPGTVVSAPSAVTGGPGANDGRHQVRAVAFVDDVESAVAGLSFAIDTVAPSVSVTGVVDGEVARGPLAPAFTVDDAFPGPVLATLDGAPFDSGAEVSDEGAHVLVVDAADLAGNETVVTVSFFVDQTPPTVAITFPADGAFLPPPVVPVAEAADDHPGTLVLDVDGVLLGADGAVSTAGTHVLHAKAVDLAGNTAVASVTFTVVVSTPPDILVTRLGEPATGDRVTLYDEGGARVVLDTALGALTDGEVTGSVDDAGKAQLGAVPPGRYRARIEHIWQRFFTGAFDVPGGTVLFDVPDEPAYAAVLYVDPAGGDDGADGSATAPFATLVHAVDVATSGGAAAVFHSVIKVAGGTVAAPTDGSGRVVLPRGLSVRGGHRAGSWVFSPADQVTVIAGGVDVGDDAELLDVTVQDATGAGVHATGSSLVRDVKVLGAAGDGVVFDDTDLALAANDLVDGAGGDGVVVNGAGVGLENLTIVDAAGAGLRQGSASVARSIATGSTGDDVVGDAAGDAARVVSDGVVFVAGPLHARYLAQARGGQDNDSAGVDAAAEDAGLLDLRGRTTSVRGNPDVGAADFGYHAWPVVPALASPPPPPPAAPPSCGCSGAGGPSAALPFVALLGGLLLCCRRRTGGRLGR